MSMKITDIIAEKRHGNALDDEAIRFWIDHLEDFADYQNSALLMAIAMGGMDARETLTLTDAMARSGDMLDLSRYGDATVDKHSTGGVGDGTSFIVMPVMAATGRICAKLSGRGLGHTGGTLDKLESIDGVHTDISEKRFFEIVDSIGIAIAGQTAQLCPADKYLYALRDVTATVDSIPLIAASVMSKKLAAGARNIVLDVKTGRGAFMKGEDDAKTLARAMVDIGRRSGRNVSALVTTMDMPLESAVGNAIEVRSALDVLSGRERGDVCEVAKALCAQLGADGEEFDRAIASGTAYEKFEQMIYALGGKPGCLQNLPQSKYQKTVFAPKSGYISDINAMTVASVALDAGGGRRVKEDAILPEVGVKLHVAAGDRTDKGQPLATLHYSRIGDEELAQRLASAFVVSDEKPIVRDRIVCKVE